MVRPMLLTCFPNQSDRATCQGGEESSIVGSLLLHSWPALLTLVLEVFCELKHQGDLAWLQRHASLLECEV